MTDRSIDRLLSQLEESKTDFSARACARTLKLLAKLVEKKFPDAESLIRFHEALLFMRAYPQSAESLKLTEDILSSFGERVEQLRSAGADISPFDYIEYSGIAGTTISGTFSYAIALWLINRYPESADADWERYEKKERLGATWPRFLPLLEEDSLVEANIPYQSWLRAAKGQKGSGLSWLLSRFERLPFSHREKAELYDSMELPILWDIGNSRASRTKSKRRVRNLFYHDGPLIHRSEVSISSEFGSPPIVLKKLSARRGREILDMVREATTVRYRELYGITNGDPESVMRAGIGRGTEVFLWGLPPERRLPLRAYAAGFTLKNGVPINYIEGIALFERVEVGFNTFYTFREGESAWVYARVLKLLHQTLGATCISIDPYQIGLNNEEAIESGAFWFYRKMGFRPAKPELAKLAAAEENKIKTRPGYRTPARALRRLATGHMVFEAPGTSAGDWDRFQIRNIGLAVQRRMAEEFNGHADEIRVASINKVARALEVRLERLKDGERRAFENLSLMLALIPDLDAWTKTEKRETVRIIRAKAADDEWDYLRKLQDHAKLRQWVLSIRNDEW